MAAAAAGTRAGASRGTNPGTGPSADPATGGRRTRRQLLSTYYGVGLEQPAAAAAVLDPTNIDSAVFNPETYFETLLNKKDLRSLIKIDNDLLAETKKLDSDMKTLVYENYNKFISATDTIRQMKTNVINMEEEIKRLAENMGKISTSSDQISSTLSARREKIEELTGIYRLLKKRQFLFELPARLNRCIDMEAYVQASQYYTGASGILCKFKHLPSFQSIQTECDQIIGRLKGILKEKMNDETSSPQVVAEFIGVLLDLGESVQSLRADYLSGKEKVFQQKFQAFAARSSEFLAQQKEQKEQKETAESDEPEKQPDSQPQTMEKFISEMILSFLADFLEFCATFQTLFLQRSSLSRDSVHQSKLRLDEFTKTLFSEFLSYVRSLLMETEDAADVIKGLEIVYRSLANIHNQFSDLGINDRATEIVNNTVHSRIEKAFETLQNFISEHLRGVANALAGPQKPDDKNLSELCEITYEAILEAIRSHLLRLKPFFAVRERHLDFLTSHSIVFVAKYGVKIQQLFLTLNILFSDFLEPKNNACPKFLLLLSKLALRFEMQGVLQVYDLAVEIVTAKQQDDLNINTTDLVQRLASIAQKVLSQYMRVQGQKISQLIRKGIETPDWLSSRLKEPRDVRLVVMILSEIEGIHREVGQIFEDSPELEESSASSPGIASVSSTRLKRNLFNKKTKLSEEIIQFNRNSIIGGITVIFLKSFFECCRLRTFAKFGLQQIQVEIAFLKRILRKFVGNQPSVDALLDEVLSSTAERCVEPVLMEKNVRRPLFHSVSNSIALSHCFVLFLPLQIVDSICEKRIDKGQAV